MMHNIEISEAKKNNLAAALADQILAEADLQQPVSGEKLQRFTKFPQVNQFLLFQVFQVWQLQIARFRHSYFDFDHPEVENQLQVLQNLLSRHIAISAADMKPLLRNAIYNTLSLLTNPGESLKRFFFTQMEQISRDRYKSLVPFFHHFDFAVASILRYHEKQNLDTVDRDVFAVKLAKVFELFEDRGNDLDSYRAERLEALTGKSIATLQEEDRKEEEARQQAEAREAAEAEEAARREAERARKAAQAEAEAQRMAEEARKAAEEAEARRRQSSFFDALKVSAPEIELEAPPEAEEPLVIEEPKPAPKAEKPREEETPAPSNPVEEPAGNDAPPSEPSKAPTVADKLRTSQETVADKLKGNQETVAEKFLKLSEEDSTVVSKMVDQLEESKETKKDRAEEQPEAAEKPSGIQAPAAPELEPETQSDPEPEEEEKPSEPELQVDEKPVERVTGGSVLDRFRKATQPRPEPTEPDRPLTVADRFRKEKEGDGPSVNPKIAAGKEINPDDIPVHKQYQYVQKVFGGNHARFRAVIDKVNHAENAAEVEDILNKYVLNSGHFKAGDPLADEFVALVKKRY